jgi:glycosyltransferase involved in cell wall biosynthesis
LRLVYISSSEYPHPTANGVQVVKQCNAFSRIVDDVLLLGRYAQGNDRSVKDIRLSYQIEEKVRLALMNFGVRPALVRSLLYPFWAALNTPLKTELVYGRHLLSLLVVALLKRPQRVIFECHAPPKGYLKPLLRFLARTKSFICVVTISDALKGILLKEYNFLAPQDVIVAHDACDPQPVIDFEPQPLSVGYVGGIYQGRGLELIVELAGRAKDVEFHIVGGDRGQLAALTGKPIPSNVICHGRVSQNQLGNFYRKFSVALAPYSQAVSTPDGTDTSAYMSPLKIFEYMGWGKVVLASNLPSLREVLADGANSLLLSPEDVDAWEGALHLMRDHDMRRKYALQAYADASERFSWDSRAHFLLSKTNANL